MSHSIYHSTVNPFPSMERPVVGRRVHRSTSTVGPNFALRRLAAALTALLALVLFATVLLAGPGGRPASASRAVPATNAADTTYVASAGDTLWSIAQTHRGTVGIDRYVDALIDLNGGTAIQVSQAVRLP